MFGLGAVQAHQPSLLPSSPFPFPFPRLYRTTSHREAARVQKKRTAAAAAGAAVAAGDESTLLPPPPPELPEEEDGEEGAAAEPEDHKGARFFPPLTRSPIPIAADAHGLVPALQVRLWPAWKWSSVWRVAHIQAHQPSLSGPAGAPLACLDVYQRPLYRPTSSDTNPLSRILSLCVPPTTLAPLSPSTLA